MSRRALTLMVAGLLTLALAVVGAWFPVPYVVLSPGPTENTLGVVKGKPVIEIRGHKVYPTSGMLSLVTVAYQGGPGNRVDLLTALRGWIDSSMAVVPEETIFPRSSTPQQVQQENTQEMASSQQLATAAALTELKIPVRITVGSIVSGSPAAAVLKVGDEIEAVDGVRATTTDQVAAAVQKHKPGEKVRMTIKRGGKTLDLTVGTMAGENGKALVGVTMAPKLPFDVDINVGEVGGPSAGLMFSLGIYDKLTPGALTGGKAIAGTGTITQQGQVGPIGGIQQKMVGARDAGATIFLTPADNCAEALQAVPDGLSLVKVSTMHGAIQAIDKLRSGSADVPRCSAG
jgi:PDZ domain-containing protein